MKALFNKSKMSPRSYDGRQERGVKDARTSRPNLGSGKERGNRRRDGGVKPGASGATGTPRDWGKVALKVVAFGLLATWGVLWSRFFVLQLIEGPEYAARARGQHVTAETIHGRRGSILDRNGNVLATTIESYSLSARPSEIDDLRGTCDFLAKVLNTSSEKLQRSLQNKRGFAWVARQISDRDAKIILTADLPGLYLHKEYERVYPYKHLAGQLLGFVGIDNKGLDGLEAAFEERLSGQELRKIVQRDGRGARLYLDGREEADELSGQDLRLSIDVQIQYFAEAALARTVRENDAAWGGCLVVDVPSGDILAWAQYPFFNPNAYNKHPEGVRRNRLALDALEQGSTVKPFVVAAGLQEKKINREQIFFCENGKWQIYKHVVKDTRPHGNLNVEQILRYSSNIGAGKIGLELGAPTYGGYLQSLGFGRRTGLPLLAESPGILRSPAKWPENDLIASSFGQSFSATGLQMAQAYLVLAGGGRERPLQLVMDRATRRQTEGRQIFRPEVNAEVLSMLKSVVQSDDGGGRQARIAGLEIGGKTGTAQKADKGIYGEKRTASFVGMVPAEKPRYLVLVIVDEPQKSVYGSSVAAPAFREVVRDTLAYNSLSPEEAASMFADGSRGSDVSGDAFDILSLDLASYAQARARLDAESKTAARLGRTAGGGPAPAGNVAPGSSLRLPVESSAEPKTDLAEVVPDVRGMSVRGAVELFAHKGIMPVLKGQGGTVVRQSPPPGSAWPAQAGQVEMEYILWLEENVL